MDGEAHGFTSRNKTVMGYEGEKMAGAGGQGGPPGGGSECLPADLKELTVDKPIR